MPKSLRWYFYLIFFSPFVGYLTYPLWGFAARQVFLYLVIPIFLIFYFQRRTKLYFPKLLIPYIFYTIYIFVWNTQNGYIEDKGLIKYIFNNYHIYFILLLIIIYNTKISNTTYLYFIKLSKIILFIAIIGALIQFFINPNFFVRSYGWNSDNNNIFLNRRPSVFSYVSDQEHGVSVLAFFSLIICFQNRQRKTMWLLIYIIIIGIYSLLTNFRFIMMGFIIVILQLLINKKTAKNFINVFYMFFVILVIYNIFTSVIGVNFNQLSNERLFVEGSFEETSRYGAVINFLRFFPETPIFGTGVHLTREIEAASREIGSSQIHVGYLSHLVSYGIVGSFFLFYFWYLLAKDLYKKAKLKGFFGPFFAFLVFLFTNLTLVDYNLFYSGIVIALVISEYYYKNNLNYT